MPPLAAKEAIPGPRVTSRSTEVILALCSALVGPQPDAGPRIQGKHGQEHSTAPHTAERSGTTPTRRGRGLGLFSGGSGRCYRRLNTSPAGGICCQPARNTTTAKAAGSPRRPIPARTCGRGPAEPLGPGQRRRRPPGATAQHGAAQRRQREDEQEVQQRGEQREREALRDRQPPSPPPPARPPPLRPPPRTFISHLL